MQQKINKDTIIFASFSQKAGNKGCEFFNMAFNKYEINAIYKSFSVSSIIDAANSAKVLNFGGFAVSMPFKKKIVEWKEISKIDSSVIYSGYAANTIKYENKTYIAYNTDYYGVMEVIKSKKCNLNSNFYILGNGGLAGTVNGVCQREFDINPYIITRLNWNDIPNIKNSIIYNCTPCNVTCDSSNTYIDCNIGTDDGDLLHKYQSRKQFKIYTGIDYDD